MHLLKKIRLASVAILATLSLTACASGTLPVEISNGSVGGSDRITADATNGSVFGFSTNSDNKDHYLADAVREKLASHAPAENWKTSPWMSKPTCILEFTSRTRPTRRPPASSNTFFGKGARPLPVLPLRFLAYTVRPSPDTIEIFSPIGMVRTRKILPSSPGRNPQRPQKDR